MNSGYRRHPPKPSTKIPEIIGLMLGFAVLFFFISRLSPDTDSVIQAPVRIQPVLADVALLVGRSGTDWQRILGPADNVGTATSGQLDSSAGGTTWLYERTEYDIRAAFDDDLCVAIVLSFSDQSAPKSTADALRAVNLPIDKGPDRSTNEGVREWDNLQGFHVRLHAPATGGETVATIEVSRSQR
jgi:hypothetical protein